MNQDEALDKLTPIFHEVFGNDDIELNRELTAAGVDEWDSLSHIRLIVAIEHSFGVRFKSTEVGGLETLGDIIDLIAEKSN